MNQEEKTIMKTLEYKTTDMSEPATSGPRLPKSGEVWASKETGLTVKIMKADDDAVWWENPAIWSFPCQTQTAAFLAAMNLSAPCSENREPLTDREKSVELSNEIECACNAITDSVLCSGNDPQTTMHFVRKLRRAARCVMDVD